MPIENKQFNVGKTIADIRAEVSETLTNSQRVRLTTSKEQSQIRQEYVADLRKTTSETLTQIRAERQALADVRSKDRQAYVVDLRRRTLDAMATYRAQQAATKADIVEMKKAVFQLRNDFQKAHRAMAQEQQQVLVEYTDLLWQDMVTFRARLQDEQAEMAQTQARELVTYRRELQIEVDAFLEYLNPGRRQIPTAVPSNSAINAIPEIAPSVQVKPTQNSPSVTADLPDNLTVIRGIGPKTDQKLRDAGIRTYQTLADMTPDTLAEIIYGPSQSEDSDNVHQTLDTMVRLSKVNEWIEAAQILADAR